MTKRYGRSPDYVVPPGVTLREVLNATGRTQTDLARATGLSTKHINQVIQGAAGITIHTARLFEKETGIPARLWLALDANYQLGLSEGRPQLPNLADYLAANTKEHQP